MTSMKKLIAVTALCLAGTSAFAAPITYTYSGSWTSFVNGTMGATYVADITFDNGGSNPANQVFTQTNFVSASLNSGTYSNTWGAGDVTGWAVNFSSDALGQLGAGWVDLANAGGSIHFDTWWPDVNVNSSTGSAGYFSSNVSAVGKLESAPEPATMSLLALGLAGLGALRKKSRV